MSIEKTTGQGQTIAVICTMSCKDALIDLVPEFEHESGYKVDATYGAGPELTNRIRDGLRADIFVGPEEFSGPLIDEGHLRAGSRTAVAHSGAALAVKSGTRKPDISTAEKLKSALLSAKGISYSRGASGIHFLQACEKLGIADAVAAKLVKPRAGEMVGPVIVRGDAEIGVQQPAELLPVEGIDIIGPLPPELRQTIVYGVTAFADSQQEAATKAFVDFLRSAPARKVLQEKGLDPA